MALWHLHDGSRLSSAANAFLLDAAADGNKIAVSSISLVELVYLVDKRRLPVEAYLDLAAALRHPDHLLVETPVSSLIAEAMRGVLRDRVPDMPDRIVAATGLLLDVPVISRDGRVRAANLRTIW